MAADVGGEHRANKGYVLFGKEDKSVIPCYSVDKELSSHFLIYDRSGRPVHLRFAAHSFTDDKMI